MNKGKLRRKLLLGIASVKSNSNLLTSKTSFGEWYRSRDKHGRLRVRLAFQNLTEKGIINVSRNETGLKVSLTASGEKEVKHYRADEIQIIPRPKWDGKWRMVFINIPESKKFARTALRKKFKSFGFYPIQRSVWLYPHECRTEIIAAANYLGVFSYVRLAELKSLDGENEIKKFFGLG